MLTAKPETANEFLARTPRRHRRPEAAGDPGLPGDQGSAGVRQFPAGTDLTLGQTRLSDPRRHPDHVAGRGTEDRVRKLSSRLRAGTTRVHSASPFNSRGTSPDNTAAWRMN